MTKFEKYAKILHEATQAVDSDRYTRWDELPARMQELAVTAVEQLLQLPPKTPKELHEFWAAPLLEEGWIYGPYDRDAKCHPCLVDYELLSDDEKLKDMIWGALIEVFKTQCTQ